MKINSLILFILLTGENLLAGEPLYPKGFEPKQQNQSITFTENKGQVSDQNNKPRPDVLFGGNANGMVFHLRNNGISYQLNRVDSWKTEDTLLNPHHRMMPGENREIPDQITTYRVDVEWLHCNQNARIHHDETIPGHSNYYSPVCPNGVTEVHSYKGLTYQNLYLGIDLHYYESNSDLKCDYLIAPHADYKQIKLGIKGALKITVQEDGSLLIATPLGVILEEKPKVFQDGKNIDASWELKGTLLSFKIGNYDPNKLLIIDPLTRIWGTYYGGNATDYARGSCIDPSGNVFFCGTTGSANGTSIATAGSHQSTWGLQNDGFVTKMNANGTRLWATYYGDTGNEWMHSCAADALGSVYCTGWVASASSNAVISTTTGHQPIHGGGTSEGFFVKFNSNGVRSWGSYYGGNNLDDVLACAVDASNNLYIAGTSASTAGISTPGSHQPVNASTPGTGDIFLAKFTPSGTRLWGTYYGGWGNESSADVCIDNSGNVYLSGTTDGWSAASIFTTVGCHQSTYGGSLHDLILVKFNGNGVRLWSTFYGGSGADYGTSCTTDASGNVFLAGCGTTMSGTHIATPGCYQSINNGSWDAFVAKFNPGGTRLWGTFFGGPLYENVGRCAVDALGNFYLFGLTQSSTSIATPGMYQTTHGGGSNDVYLAKFSSSGLLAWSTYYGGNDGEVAYCARVDNTNSIYLLGVTSSTNNISQNGHQNVYGGAQDGFLAKFSECPIPTIVNGTSPANQGPCSNKSATLAAISTGSVTWYSSPSGTSSIGSGTSYITPTLSPGTYSYYAQTSGTCGVNPYRVEVIVTVYSFPTITVNSGSVCAGKSFTVNPSGANTYSITGGSFIVSPNVSSNYTITGAHSPGCTTTVGAVCSVLVFNAPTITVPNGSICSGNSFTISPSGAFTYTYSSGTNIVNPNSTSAYTVTGTSTAGCTNSVGAVCNVTVKPSPTISVNSGSICQGQSFTISPSGANSYTVSNGNFVVSPITNSNYSVTGTSTAACLSNTVIASVTVNPLPNIAAISSPSAICAGESAVLTASGANSYTWNPSGNTNTLSVTPTTTTTYSVSGTDNKGCSNSVTISTLVKPNPTLSVNSTSICAGTSVVLSSSVIPAGSITYSWLPGGENNASINVNPNSTSVYSVVVSLEGCLAMTTSTVSVVTSMTPNVAFSYNGPYCTIQNSVSPNLNPVFSSGGQFISSPPGLVIDPNTGMIDLNSSEPGNYQVTYTFAASACSVAASGVANIQVVLPVSLNLVPQLSMLTGESTTLSVSGASSYTWTPPDHLSCTTCSNPVASPPHSMTYCVSSPEEECISKTCVEVKVETGCDGQELSLPNAFSPNGDGNNDEYCLRGWNRCITEFRIIIYNRWGENVYESEDTEFCWDGSYKGKIQETEVFVYMLKAKLKDGTQISKNGNITLLR